VEAGVAWPKPGRKKLAGETLYEPLRPPQPTAAAIAAVIIANRSVFQLNFTLIVWGCSNMGATFKYPVGNGFVVQALACFALAGERLLNRLKAELHTIIWALFGLKPGFRTWMVTLSVVAFSFSMASAAEEHDFVAEAEAAYRAAQAVYSTNQSLEAGIAAARTAFDYADLAPNDDIRERVANNGIAIARAAIAKNTNSAAAHYYLALDIGQLARTKMLGALKLLTEMERELKIVIQLDPKFDYAGGYRTLGVLYLEAPGWPTSVGSKSKARLNLEKAVELAPESPENHLCLLEALVKWKEWKLATDRLAEYQAMLPKAKEKFTGADWAYEWHDWAKREQAIQSKIQKH
jgi:hypothetical protein